MNKAASRIADAVQAGETIGVFGDYDVDGATSTALLTRYLGALGISTLYHIPDRITEGYGPNAPALIGLKERGASLVITVDCGAVSYEPLKASKEAGVEVAVVNPNRFDETSEHRQLAAVGVTFLLIVAVNKLLRERGVDIPNPLTWLDLVALGTICDVVPLTGVNRAFASQGLKVMCQRQNVGIRTLIDIAGVDDVLSTYHAGFILGPRINAGGRVGKADLGIRLLATEDEAEAHTIAQELDRYNAERKAIEAQVQDQAMAQAEALPNDSPIIIVHGKGWHQGVIGIVAGRIKEQFNTPTAVIAIDEHGIGKASARSIPGVDLGAAVTAARNAGLLLAGGGHAMAAGFSIEDAKIGELLGFLTERVTPSMAEHGGMRTLKLDGYITPGALTPELINTIDQAAPFGQGNSNVRIVVNNVVIYEAKIVGDNHVRVVAGNPKEKSRFAGIAFRAGENALGDALLHANGKEFTLVGKPQLNRWQGRESVDLHIEDGMIS
jgi:single-stranded-DNA-specific exonuclease